MTPADSTSFSASGSAPIGFGNQAPNANNAKVWFAIFCCISDDDRRLIKPIGKSAPDVWYTLRNKYKEKLHTVNHQLQKDFIGYEKPKDKTIEEAWTELEHLGSRIVEYNPTLQPQTSPLNRLFIFLQALPADYETLVDGIRAQTEPDVERTILKLQEKEAILKERETAMWAKSGKGRPTLQPKGSRAALRGSRSKSSMRRKSSTSDSESGNLARNGREFLCLLCDSPEHHLSNCPHKDWAKMRVKRHKERLAYEKDKSYNKKSSKRHQAYNVEDTSDEISLSDEQEELDKETAALSKELAGKPFTTDWVADSGASSHMTDQLRLFRGPLTRIKRRTIKVGGGRLYSDRCGTAVLQAPDGNKALLSSVLLVPKLGVNLLSGRKMCQTGGLEGRFNPDSLFFENQYGEQVVKAQHRNGVYIVSDIAAGLDGTALSATVQCSCSNLTETAFNSRDMVPSPQEARLNKLEDLFNEPETLFNKPSQVEAYRGAPDERKQIFRLWHRRFAHLGKEKLRNLYKVTTLKKPIPITEEDGAVCCGCALTKMVNRRNHYVSQRKTSLLALISIDVCGPLPPSRLGYSYFLHIVDNYSRRLWVLLMKNRTDCVAELTKWKATIEF